MADNQTKGIEALKSRVLVSSSSRALLDEIKAHRKGIDEILARVNVLWFDHGSSPSKMKEALEKKLKNGIKDIDNLEHVLATTAVRAFGSCKIVSPTHPGGDPSCKDAHAF
jgi:hypothetical protein